MLNLNFDEINILQYLNKNDFLYEKDYYKFDSTEEHLVIRSLFQKKLIYKNGIIPHTIMETKKGKGMTKIWITEDGKAAIQKINQEKKKQKRKDFIEIITLLLALATLIVSIFK